MRVRIVDENASACSKVCGVLLKRLIQQQRSRPVTAEAPPWWVVVIDAREVSW